MEPIMWVMLVAAIYVAISMVVDIVHALWRHDAAKALRVNGILWVLLGVVSVVFYQLSWVNWYHRGWASDAGYGGFEEWVYLLPFVIALASFVACGAILVTQRIKGYLSERRNRTADSAVVSEVN